MQDIIKKEISSHIETFESISKLSNDIEKIANILIKTLKNKKKIILFGNGGSASDSNHIVAELVGRYKIDRDSLPAISLCSNSAIITSIANDYGYDYIFSKQIQSIANENDSIIAISTSGNSKNVINGILEAKKKKCNIIALSGYDGGEMKSLCDICLNIASHNTPRIQEAHIFIGHLLCHIIEQNYKEIIG